MQGVRCTRGACAPAYGYRECHTCCVRRGCNAPGGGMQGMPQRYVSGSAMGVDVQVVSMQKAGVQEAPGKT